MERLLDDGPNLRWKAMWPPDAGDLLTRRATAIEQRHHPTVVLEGSGTGTPSIMDGPPLEPGSFPDQLRAIDVQIGAHGTIWAHYEVVARGSTP